MGYNRACLRRAPRPAEWCPRWLKEHDWKSCRRENPVSRVRIPPTPPTASHSPGAHFGGDGIPNPRGRERQGDGPVDHRLASGPSRAGWRGEDGRCEANARIPPTPPSSIFFIRRPLWRGRDSEPARARASRRQSGGLSSSERSEPSRRRGEDGSCEANVRIPSPPPMPRQGRRRVPAGPDSHGGWKTVNVI